MKISREDYYTPFIIVAVSVLSSIVIFFIINAFYPHKEYYLSLIKAIIIPIVISLPITIFTTRYHKKIFSQKTELEQLNQINNKLISIIAHDIRSPLSIVQGFIEIIHDDLNKNNTDKIHNKLDTISTRIDGLLLFLNDLIKWSKNQIHVAPVTMASFSTSSVISKITNTYLELQKQKNINTTVNLGIDELLSDKEIYSFIVRNLYHNALKFTNESGSVEIQIKKIGKQIYTIVKDNGVGIKGEDIDKIKDNKQWFTTPGTSNEKGTGLGIKTILQYLKICNGELLIESVVNKGTTITVILPVKEMASIL